VQGPTFTQVPDRNGMPQAGPTPEPGHVPVLELPLGEIWPSGENEELYGPVAPSDPEVRALARSIRKHGVQEPLVITEDHWIISGHRRHTAAMLAGLDSVPCRVHPIRRRENHDEFVVLLRECNRQRIKTFDQKLREEVISANPKEAYRSLREYREQASSVVVDTIKMGQHKQRCRISDAKGPFLAAIGKVIADRRAFWPLSDRQVHYALLNDPPRVHARKPHSVYANDLKSYKALTDLLARARLAGDVPFEAIADPTRPVTVWGVHRDCQMFLRQELDGFLKGYWRDLMQSQPNHIEIVAEKNTVHPILRPVAAEYCIPLTVGRGYCSLPPRHEMAKRFRRSGKSSLILLILSDFDPDGEEIAASFARSMRDDFGVAHLEPVKVALTEDQVEESELPPGMVAKKTSMHHAKFTEKYGQHVYELEALPPDLLQDILREAIDDVIDNDALDHEREEEEREAADLEKARRRAHRALGDLADAGEA